MNFFETMKELTIRQEHRFNKKIPLFTVAVPSNKKTSIFSGFDKANKVVLQLNASSIDITVRAFPVLSAGKIVDTEEK